MAKFYQRYFPATPDKTVLYGYRGANLIVNGQNYTASNNLEQIGNYQFYPACTDNGATMAPITVACVFEPSYIANQFDLTGSKFSGEFDAGNFQSYNSYTDVNGLWSFKNYGSNAPTCFNVNTSSVTSCLQGCVLPGSIQGGTYCCIASSLANGVVSCNPYANYYIVQSPAAEKVSDNPELVLAETLYVPGLV
jgi:hypothetical protein